MATKKKTTKKQTKTTGNAVGQFYGNQAAQVPVIVPLPEALKAFDDALEKVTSLRSVILPNLTEEVVANRARRLADAAHHLQVAGWNLRESAYHEADK